MRLPCRAGSLHCRPDLVLALHLVRAALRSEPAMDCGGMFGVEGEARGGAAERGRVSDGQDREEAAEIEGR